MNRRRLMAVALLLALASCSKKQQELATVEGVVRLKGKPIANLQVEFLPDPEKGNFGKRASGTTDKEGRYRLINETQEPGAAVGWNRVVLADLDAPQAQQGQPPSQPRFPLVYSEAARTPLRFEVKPGQNPINIDLP